jgi:putative oxidoreductase
MLVTLLVRYMAVALFFPFSALDKILNFNGAVGQAQELVRARGPATALILAGLAVEILTPLGILTGVADRLAAFILAGYCGVTALLWKQFWAPGDFWQRGQSKGRDLFWDFLKNFAVAGGLLLITTGLDGSGLPRFLGNPLGSTHPYSASSGAGAARPS